MTTNNELGKGLFWGVVMALPLWAAAALAWLYILHL